MQDPAVLCSDRTLEN